MDYLSGIILKMIIILCPIDAVIFKQKQTFLSNETKLPNFELKISRFQQVPANPHVLTLERTRSYTDTVEPKVVEYYKNSGIRITRW